MRPLLLLFAVILGCGPEGAIVVVGGMVVFDPLLEPFREPPEPEPPCAPPGAAVVTVSSEDSGVVNVACEEFLRCPWCLP